MLTVEDDPIVRADLRLVLEEAGFNVCADARDGLEAVALARQHRPDLVLIDLGLPHLDGVEATRQILSERDVPVVALTGHRSGTFVARAIEAGASAHVLKPFHTTHLVDTVEAVLAARGERDAQGRPTPPGMGTPTGQAPSPVTEEALARPGRRPDAWDWDYAMPVAYVRWFNAFRG